MPKNISIWKEYEKIGKNGDFGFKKLTFLERFEFYERFPFLIILDLRV